MKRAIASLAVFLLSYTVATALMQPAPPTYADLAQQICPTEWAALNSVRPPAYLENLLDPLNNQIAVRDFGSTPSQNTILHRPFLLIIVTDDFVGRFLALEEPKFHTPNHMAQTEAQLALINCLDPTPKERREIVQTMALVAHTSEADASKGYTIIFQKIDHMFCMGFDKAFEAMKTLDPTSTTYKQDVEATMEATMTICPEP
ncbi:hypothetical protein J7413_13125 [Shimia sp. R10_1]|uniref:hypothetical protein n=1 Tax=Shimia sp. R10_1 TaxID=2821095 RepID=UPI001ADC3F88|nr:hypothetical protein [Shimia sp. R10_1]MBO9474486.1 hypothetical protein [Shimia sp. R10_1]